MNWYQKIANLSPEEAEKLDNELINELNLEYRQKWIPINSSFIHEVNYDVKSKILKVKIKTQEGIRTYTFVNVPKNIFDDFMNSSSKGNFFNSIIRGKYNNIKIANNKDEVVNLADLSNEERFEGGKGYVSIGHKWVKDIGIELWVMDNNGEIQSKKIFNPEQVSHGEIFNINGLVYDFYIAFGRFDKSNNICSLMIEAGNRDKITWIKTILREKFGPNIVIKTFIDRL